MLDATTQPGQPLVFLTNRVGRLLANTIRRQLPASKQEVPTQYMGVLADLWHKDGVRQQDLAISAIKDKATITRILKFLEERNIVVRISDETDRRNKRIYLTHKGKSLKTTLMPYAQSVVDQATCDIPEEDLQTCCRVLGQIYDTLQRLQTQP